MLSTHSSHKRTSHTKTNILAMSPAGPEREPRVSQRQLDRAIARATGESITTIRRLGFGIA